MNVRSVESAQQERSADPARVLAFCAAALLTAGCERTLVDRLNVPGGDTERGRDALMHHECGVCHEIPGIPGASGRVGPSLAEYNRYTYVAGKFPNTPTTLVAWLLDPPRLAPHTAMPKVPLSEQEARDMAAYLYSGSE
jgi:cytochrome c1